VITNNPITTDDKVKLEEAVHRWINGFNAIPIGVVEKLQGYFGEDVSEITPAIKGSRVYIFNKNEYGEIVEISDDGIYRVKMENNSKTIKVSNEDIEQDYHGGLPMWGSMWSFDDGVDKCWLEDEKNQKKMAACGFRIYEQEDYGYIFGIDGIGYSFYDAHWLPLYKARGLKWHM